MKILFLHISDIHITENSRSDIATKIEYAICALNSVGSFDHCCIVISGDITMSGSQRQYIQAEGLLKYTFKLLKDRFGNIIVKIVFVPGNHDVDLSEIDLGRKKYDEIFDKNDMHAQLEEELKKLSAFYDFSKKFHCFSDSTHELYDRKIYAFGGYSVEANLLNSAVFATKDSDKGNHYLPMNIINNVSSVTNSDFVVSVIHHSPEWFCDAVKIQLERILTEKSSVVFLGHEHSTVTKSVSFYENADAVYLTGGCFNSISDPAHSEFSCALFDTVTRRFQLQSFSLDSPNRIYKSKETFNRVLPLKEMSTSPFRIKYAFQHSLLVSDIDPIQANLSDYYVFPRLSFFENENSVSKPDIKDYESFCAFFEQNHIVSISGGIKSGKTALLRYLFNHYTRSKTVLYVSGYELSQKKLHNLLRDKFEEIYSEDSISYEKFKQLKPDDKMIFIDNVDDVKRNSLHEIIEILKIEFKYILMTTQDSVEIDIIEKLKGDLLNYVTFSKLKIEPIYSDKRKELISKVVTLKKPGIDNTLIIDALCSGISNQRYLTSFDPEFVIKYTDCFCGRTNEIVENDTAIFSKVFEANLTLAIQSAIKIDGKFSIDKIFYLISEIAYCAHKSREYPITEKTINQAISNYNEYSGDDISIRYLLDILCRARILYLNGNSLYEFSNYSYYTYFIAKAIVKYLHSYGRTDDIQELIDKSYNKIDTDILLFITYLTDSAAVIKKLISSENLFTKEWCKYSVSNNNIKYLDDSVFKPIAPPLPEDIIKDEVAKVEEERNDEKKRRNRELVSPYENSIETEHDSFQQFQRAIFLLNIIARSLPSFEHVLSKSDKKEIIRVIYELPNKIFYMLTSAVDNDLPYIIEMLKSTPENSFRRKEPLDDNSIVKRLQDISIVLLLQLYDLANTYSVKPNTLKFLENTDYYDYFSDLSTRIQHLMMLINARKCTDFSEEVIRINKLAVKPHQRSLVGRIAYNFLIDCAGIADRAQLQRVKDAVFNLDQKEEIILLSSQRIEISKTQL